VAKNTVTCSKKASFKRARRRERVMPKPTLSFDIERFSSKSD
jgi:hypothetical protein